MLHTLLPLKPYRNSITLAPLATEIRAAWSLMRKSPHWAALAQEVSAVTKRIARPCETRLTGDTVDIELPAAMTPRGFETLLKNLSPWRVGPYRIGPITINSEWQSFQKWHRIRPLLGDTKGLRIADVGCNSGYFMFKLAAMSPKLVVGFDPVERCWLQYSILQGLARIPNLAFIPAGISTVDSFSEFFDLTLCMGVIYHQRDPFTACKKLFAATRPGGRILLESLVIPGSGSVMLVPTERYAKMRNAWIVPTAETLATFLTRAGFIEPQIHSFGPITTHEQRSTDWAPYESLTDFLDPHDQTKTVEGYPAPHSALVIARKA